MSKSNESFVVRNMCVQRFNVTSENKTVVSFEMGIKDKPLERREHSESEREVSQKVELDGELSSGGGSVIGVDDCVSKNSKQLSLFYGSEMVVELTVKSVEFKTSGIVTVVRENSLQRSRVPGGRNLVREVVTLLSEGNEGGTHEAA